MGKVGEKEEEQQGKGERGAKEAQGWKRKKGMQDTRWCSRAVPSTEPLQEGESSTLAPQVHRTPAATPTNQETETKSSKLSSCVRLALRDANRGLLVSRRKYLLTKWTHGEIASNKVVVTRTIMEINLQCRLHFSINIIRENAVELFLLNYV